MEEFDKLERAVVGLVEDRKSASTFLLDSFVKNKKMVNAKTNVLDFTFDNDGIATYKENESTAPSKPKDREKNSVSVTIPSIREEQSIGAWELRERIPGYAIDMDKDMAIATLANEKLEILDDVVSRTHEAAVAQQLLSGAVSDVGLNLKRRASNTGSVTLTGQGDKSLIKLREFFYSLRLYPDIAVFSPEAYEVFFGEMPVEYKTQLAGQIKLEFQGVSKRYPDVTYEGTFAGGVDFFIYRGKYSDPKTGNRVKYVPANKVFVGNTSAKNYVYFNPVNVTEMNALVTRAQEKYFKKYVDHKTNSMIIEAYSNALPVLNDINATGVITVS